MRLRNSCFAIALMLFSASSLAAEHVITAQATKFSPLVVLIEPGDTVTFQNMVGHNADAMEGLVPEGAELFKIPLGTNGSLTLDKEGVYIYKCTPHFALGMVGAIVVGEATNMDSVVANAKGMAKRAVIKAKKAVEAKGS